MGRCSGRGMPQIAKSPATTDVGLGGSVALDRGKQAGLQSDSSSLKILQAPLTAPFVHHEASKPEIDVSGSERKGAKPAGMVGATNQKSRSGGK